MDLIDDRGQLFGAVNIVDALVVLVVVAVGAAGVSLVSGPATAPSDQSTTVINATVDLGDQPAYIVENIKEGDRYSPNGSSDLTITDVYLAPVENGTNVRLRVQLNVTSTESGVRYNGAPPRLGRDINIRTDTYEVNGTIRDVGGPDTIQTEDVSVVIRTTIQTSETSDLTEATDVRIAGQSVGTINDVAIYGGNGEGTNVAYVSATIQTDATEEIPTFGDTALRRGARVTLPIDGTQISGRIESIGGLERESKTVLVSDTVTPDVASAISEGDRYRVAGRDIATVNSVTTYESGTNRYVYAELDITTVNDTGFQQFGETVVLEGASIPFKTQEYELSGTIEQVDEIKRTTTDVVVSDTVPPETASDIDVGDTYRVSGQRIATVETVTGYGVANSENKRVFVGLNLTTFRISGYDWFGSTSITEGENIAFETPSYELSGAIERVNATELRGEPTSRNVRLRVRNVEPERAQTIRVGARETGPEKTVAQIRSVTRESSEVVLTSQDGNIYKRTHPVNQDVTFTANLAVRETDSGVLFKGRDLQQGQTITLNLGGSEVDATVVST